MPCGHHLSFSIGEAGHIFDSCGRSLGVFADLDALVQHAERMTA